MTWKTWARENHCANDFNCYGSRHKVKFMSLGTHDLMHDWYHLLFICFAVQCRLPATNTSNVPEPGSFYDFWKQFLTVPLILIVFILPLINFKSPTFFTKFNALGWLLAVVMRNCAAVFVLFSAGHILFALNVINECLMYPCKSCVSVALNKWPFCCLVFVFMQELLPLLTFLYSCRWRQVNGDFMPTLLHRTHILVYQVSSSLRLINSVPTAVQVASSMSLVLFCATVRAQWPPL